MAIIYAEGFESAQIRNDLISRGTINNYAASGSVTTPSDFGVSKATAAYSNGSAVCLTTNPTGPALFRNLGTTLNKSNSNLSFSCSIYYDPSASPGPTSNYIATTRYLNGSWYMYQGNGVATTVQWYPIANLGVAYTPATFRPMTTIIASTYIPDIVYWGSYYYVLAYSSSTTVLIQSRSTITGSAVSQSNSVTVAAAATVYTSLLMYRDTALGTYFLAGGDSYTTIKAFPITINGTTGAPTIGAQSLNATTDSNYGPYGYATKWAANGNWYIAAKSNANIAYKSADGGATWTAVSGAYMAMSVASTANVLVFGSKVASPSVWTQTGTGGSLTPITFSGDGVAAAMLVASNGTTFVATRINASTNLYTSTDGVSWTSHGSVTPVAKTNLVYEGNQFILTLSNGALMYSSDGVNWSTTANGYATGSTNAPMALMGLPNSGFEYGFINPTTAVYSQSSGSYSTITVPTPSTGWHTYECTLAKLGPSGYRITYSVDGSVVAKQTITTPVFPNLTSATSVTPTAGIVSVAYSDSLGVYLAMSTSVVYYSKDNVNWTNVLNVSNGTRVRRMNGVFYVFTSNGIYHSIDGLQWSLNNTLTATIYDANYANGKYLAVGAGTTNLYSSTDGTTWTTSAPFASTSGGWGAVNYAQGTWIVIPTGSGTTGYYSTDNGVTWTSFSVPTGCTVGDTASNGTRLVYANGYQIIISVTPVTGSAPSVSSYNNVSTSWAHITQIVYNGTYFFAPTWSQQAYTWYLSYSSDGLTWNALFGSTATLGYSFATYSPGQVTFFGTAFSNPTTYYNSVADMPMGYASAMTGISAIDDIIVSDGNTPHPGPQGSVRIYSVPSNTDVQNQWAPSSGTSNVAVATVVPFSNSASSYVSGNSVGNKDIYGTNAGSFTVPVNFNPLAMTVEAYATRLLPSPTSIQLGIVSNGVESDAPSTNIIASSGNSQFLQKIYNSDPGQTSGIWSANDVQTSQVTITKTV